MLISNCTYSHQRASRRPKLTKEHLRKRERWPKNSWAPHRFLWGVKLQNWPVISRDGREKRFPGGCVGSMWYRPPATSAGPGDLFGNATNPKVRDRYWPSVLAHFEPGGGKANRFRGCPRNPQLNGVREGGCGEGVGTPEPHEGLPTAFRRTVKAQHG